MQQTAPWHVPFAVEVHGSFSSGTPLPSPLPWAMVGRGLAGRAKSASASKPAGPGRGKGTHTVPVISQRIPVLPEAKQVMSKDDLGLEAFGLRGTRAPLLIAKMTTKCCGKLPCFLLNRMSPFITVVLLSTCPILHSSQQSIDPAFSFQVLLFTPSQR